LLAAHTKHFLEFRRSAPASELEETRFRNGRGRGYGGAAALFGGLRPSGDQPAGWNASAAPFGQGSEGHWFRATNEWDDFVRPIYRESGSVAATDALVGPGQKKLARCVEYQECLQQDLPHSDASWRPAH